MLTAIIDHIGPIRNRQAHRQVGHAPVEAAQNVFKGYVVAAGSDSGSDTRLGKIFQRRSGPRISNAAASRSGPNNLFTVKVE
jgi:hypothetical protein